MPQSIIADEFSTILSAKTGVPLIPPNISGATAVMWVRFEDMNDYELKLPESDYAFQLNLKRFAKIQHSKNNVGSSYIYAAYIDIAFREPMGNITYLESELKNGEVAVVPAGREAGDDFPAYQDAIRGLFGKFADSVARQDLSWIAKAASAKDIQSQIKKTREILESCKK
mgnify:FL=1